MFHKNVGLGKMLSCIPLHEILPQSRSPLPSNISSIYISGLEALKYEKKMQKIQISTCGHLRELTFIRRPPVGGFTVLKQTCIRPNF